MSVKQSNQILKLDDAANTAAYNEALQYFESLGFRGKIASDLAIGKVHNNVLFDAGTLPEVDVVAKAWGDGYDASRRENYQEARKSKRKAEEKAQQHEMNQSIREATDKWGKGIGYGLEMVSGFTPLWWAAPATRTGLALSKGDYKGAALNVGLAFVAPYAVGKAFQHGSNLYRGYKSMTNPNNVYEAMAEGITPVMTSNIGTTFGRNISKISPAESWGVPKSVRNNKNIVREVPDSQLDDKIWILKDGTYQEGTFRDIKAGKGHQFKYDPKDAVSYTYTSGPDKNPLNPEPYQLSDGNFLGFYYQSEYSARPHFLKSDSHIYNHELMQSNSALYDKLSTIASKIQIPKEQYAQFLNPRYILSFKQYYLNKGWRVGKLTDDEIAKIIAYNHKQLTSNQTGIAKDLILWNGSGKQTTADGTIVREAAPDNFKIITENLQGGAEDPRGVWLSYFDDALAYGYPKQVNGSRQHTWEGVQQVDIQPYLVNDARGHMSAGSKFNKRVGPKNIILHSRELVSGDLDNIKGLFPHPDLILQEGNGFTRSWSTKGLHYKKGGSIHTKKKNNGKFAKVRDYINTLNE